MTAPGVTVRLADVLPSAKPGAAPPLLGVQHVQLPFQGDGVCAALRELGALHASHTHAREAGIPESPPPWGSRKELAFVLWGDCLCLISQGLPSKPCEMSFIVQVTPQLGDVWGHNSSDPAAGACQGSVHPLLSLSQSPSFPISPPWA